MSKKIDWDLFESGRFQEARKQFHIATRILSRSRSWHWREQKHHVFHPAAVDAFAIQAPANWQQLLLEWPHVSKTDPTRIAYTRDERSGIEDRQTITTIGKYLTRHWPDLADHTIRDLVAKYGSVMEFKIERDMESIVRAVQRGPSSCMQWCDADVDNLGHHPYEHYDPVYGWHVAVGYKNGRIEARALLMQRDNRETAPKYFVRTYAHKEGSQYSQPSEELTQWLQAQGYVKKDSWRGERLAFISGTDEDDEVHAPYIDGGYQHVTVERELNSDNGLYVRYLRITDNGDYDCTGTNGTAERIEGCTCGDCGSRIREDDSYSIGYYGDNTVGECCINDYTRVTGRNGNEYYVPNGDAVEADGDWYDSEYLSDNGIVELHNGDYTHEDNATWVESQSAYYPSDEVVEMPNGEYEVEADCVQLHDGDWALEDDAWQCTASGYYYLHDDVEPVEVDGENYHPDNVPEPDDEETEPATTSATI